MPLLIAGLVLFIGTHSIAILAPATRDRLAATLGPGPWKALYAIVSLVGLVLVVRGCAAARATPVVLYSPPEAARYVALVLLLPVFPLAFASVLPGAIRSRLGHPLLAATKAWALAHLIANGTLADVVLFGSLLAWAVIERISLKRRPPRPVATAPAGRWNDLIAIVLGLALYGAMLGGLHRWLIGVAPLP
jgi:uncharacterized membrane protein